VSEVSGGKDGSEEKNNAYHQKSENN